MRALLEADGCKALDLCNCSLHGHLPEEWVALSGYLEGLDVSSNRLESDLPVFVGAMTAAGKAVDVSKNRSYKLGEAVFDEKTKEQLAGERAPPPDGLVAGGAAAWEGGGGGYAALDFTLDGRGVGLKSPLLPGLLHRLQRHAPALAALTLDGNHISGELPGDAHLYDVHAGKRVAATAREGFHGIERLDVATFSRLATLSLRRTNLEGEIPASCSELAHLKLFDVTDNRLGGALPHGVGVLKARGCDVRLNLSLIHI